MQTDQQHGPDNYMKLNADKFHHILFRAGKERVDIHNKEAQIEREWRGEVIGLLLIRNEVSNNMSNRSVKT